MSTRTSSPVRRQTPPRLLQVKRTLMLSSSLKRVTLEGDALADFPDNNDGAHIKLMFPKPHQNAPTLPTLGPKGPVWPEDHERPITRTYSVSHYNAAANELDVDLVLHGGNGPASRWAIAAKPGDAIGVAGPGGPERIKPDANWYLLIADLSSYAAMSAALKQLQDDAHGYALLEVEKEDDILPLVHPSNIEVRWLIRNGMSAGSSTLLLDAVQALNWLPGLPSIMLAGENRQVVAIRDHVLQQRKVPKKMLYAVPYWKDTYSEEHYHEERHRIMDEIDNL
jgi:NADPH-dependent ferric siderophore reductase